MQRFQLNLSDASIVRGYKEGKPWLAISGRAVALEDAQEAFGGLLFFASGPMGYALKNHLEANPFAQGSQVKVDIVVTEKIDFFVVAVEVTKEGTGSKAVREIVKGAKAPASSVPQGSSQQAVGRAVPVGE